MSKRWHPDLRSRSPIGREHPEVLSKRCPVNGGGAAAPVQESAMGLAASCEDEGQKGDEGPEDYAVHDNSS